MPNWSKFLADKPVSSIQGSYPSDNTPEFCSQHQELPTTNGKEEALRGKFSLYASFVVLDNNHVRRGPGDQGTDTAGNCCWSYGNCDNWQGGAIPCCGQCLQQGDGVDTVFEDDVMLPQRYHIVMIAVAV